MPFGATPMMVMLVAWGHRYPCVYWADDLPVYNRDAGSGSVVHLGGLRRSRCF
jgi:hypothetical protein